MKNLTYKGIQQFVSRRLFDNEIILTKDPLWPRISIVTPSYNQAQFLERTILSVLNQNYPNLEYIIVDGGSTDGSVEIIKRYDKYLAWWVCEDDEGQAHAIRKGFDRSTGSILAWLNSDDTYLPGTLYKVATAFRENGEAELIYGNIYIIDDRGNIINDQRFTQFSFFTLLFEGSCALHQTGCFWRRELYEKVGGINVQRKFCIDADFFFRAARVGKFLHLQDFLANFRIHATSKSSTIGSTIGRNEFFEIRRKYIPKHFAESYFAVGQRLSMIRRFLLYVLQGDVHYALRGLRKRSKSFFGRENLQQDTKVNE